MIDELTKVNKQNNDYRGMILENEAKSQSIQAEINDM